MELILDLLYLYIAIYSVYFFALAIRNLNDKPFRIEKRYSQYEKNANLAVVIYTHNDKDTLTGLINQLKAQDYPIANFRTYVILDNCNDGSEEIFAREPFIKVINIKDVGTIGKDQAISILLEELCKDDSIDSYVFIDGDRGISNDFLSTVNASLINNDVISGETIIITEELNIVDKIKAAYQKYHMNFMRQARSLFGLAASADSGVFIIKKKLVDGIGYVDFKDINTELKYSLMLSKIGTKCTYNPNIQTFVDGENYTFRKPRLSARINLFKDCIKEVWETKNFVFTEHVTSLLYPNIWLLAAAYLYLIKHSYRYYFVFDFKIVLLTFLLLCAGFVISLINAKLTTKETAYLAFYPLYSFCHIIKNLPPVRKIRNKIQNREDELPKGTEKMTVDVIVTAGKNDLPCKLEFISENGLAKVRFVFKSKKFTTSSHLRMIDALGELKMKLDDYGFILKICHCCKYFTNDVDGSTNMVKGFCSCDYPSPSIKEPKPTIIWNSCPEFTPTTLNSLIEEMVKEESPKE